MRRVLSPYVQLNRPLHWQSFEDLIRDLFQAMHPDSGYDKNGRNGQRQHGVDAWGFDRSTPNGYIGLQCKGRAKAGSMAHMNYSGKEVENEVAKAKSFRPELKKFMLLTTGEADVHSARKARELTEELRKANGFEVEVHDWEWISAKLRRFPDLAIQFGLISEVRNETTLENWTRYSKIGADIGARLVEYIDLVNKGRSPDAFVTVPDVADALALDDWYVLEEMTHGTSKLSLAWLRQIAADLVVHPDWLINGRGTPFKRPNQERSFSVIEQFAFIEKVDPVEIFFIRDEGEGHEACIALKVDELRYHIIDRLYSVRGFSSGDAFLYWCLIRAISHKYEFKRSMLRGFHIKTETLSKLINGDIHPSQVLQRPPADDSWWEMLLNFERSVTTDEERWSSLASAIFDARAMLNRILRDPYQYHSHADLMDILDYPAPTFGQSEG